MLANLGFISPVQTCVTVGQISHVVGLQTGDRSFWLEDIRARLEHFASE